jgi:hypothetical protein
MRKVLCVLSSMMVLASAGSAFAQDVRYNFDRQADFTKFKTYKWVTIKDAPKLSDLVDKQIKQTVEAELVKKGLTKTEADTAEKQYTSFDTGYPYGPGWGGGWYGGGGGMTSGTTTTIYIGQLAFDLYSTSPKSLVWRGVASKTIDPEAKPEKQQKNLTKAVEKVFKNYPPKEKK